MRSRLDYRLEPEGEVRRFEVITGPLSRRHWNADQHFRQTGQKSCLISVHPQGRTPIRVPIPRSLTCVRCARWSRTMSSRQTGFRRRYHGANPGEDRYRPSLGLCPRRSTLRRHSAAGVSVLRVPRSVGRSPGAASEAVHRHPASRRLCRLQPALSPRSQARPGDGGTLLEPCAAQVLRACRHRRHTHPAWAALR